MFLTILILTTSTLSSAANNLVVFQVHRSPSIIESTITSTPSLLVSHENNYFQLIKTSWGNTSVDLPDLDRTLNYTITSTEDSEWLCPPIPLIVHTFKLANKLFCTAKKLPENNGFVTSLTSFLISMTLCVLVLCTYTRTNICMIKNKESNKKLVRRRRRRPRSLTPERSRHVQESSDEEVEEEEEENANFNFDDNGLNLPPSEVLHSTPHEFSSWINNNIYQTND